jgi:hypothetical protein
VTFLQDWQADIRVSIDGTPYFDAWSTYDGADLTTQDQHVRPGGMGSQVSTGGPAERSDCTVGISFTEVVAAYHGTLESLMNHPIRISITRKDLHRNPIPGTTFTVKGLLKGTKLPGADANSNNNQFYQVVASCDEIAAT